MELDLVASTGSDSLTVQIDTREGCGVCVCGSRSGIDNSRIIVSSDEE